MAAVPFAMKILFERKKPDPVARFAFWRRSAYAEEPVRGTQSKKSGCFPERRRWPDFLSGILENPETGCKRRDWAAFYRIIVSTDSVPGFV